MPYTDIPQIEQPKPEQPIILKCEMGCCRGLPEHARREAFGRVYQVPACMEALVDHEHATVRGQIRWERNNSYRKP